VVSVTKGPFADKKVYVSSERDSCVAVVDVSDPFNAKLTKTIATGSQPMGFALSKDQSTLYVANAGSDTVSVIDVATDRVIRTVLLRPTTARNLPGVTPTGLALSPDDQTLYVTLGDMNAVAVVNLVGRRPGLKGYIPVGWYPSAIAVAPDGSLFVANAKGDQATHPNGKNAGPNGAWGNYIQDIIDGTVAKISPLSDDDLKHATEQVIQNNGVAVNLANPNRRALPETGIRHVIYIIKENRTYDQVMGDVAEGNGDRSLTLFGSDVTPNEHALAKRFVLLDNFYCCSEVSGDGWDWSTSGMASEYTVRNVPFNYSGRGRSYDFEGDNNGMPADVDDLPDVAEAPSGYIWDAVAQKKLTYRNYGFYMNFANDDKVPAGKPKTVLNYPTKKALVGHTDLDFMKFDTDYADSDAWAKYNSPAPSQKLKYGDKGSPSRFAESEFDEYVKDDNLPAFEMVRIMRDHTAGTSPRRNSPRAMVADNDYAVGQIVEAVSKSKYWKDTAIFIVEDDAQDGEDHVDAHRSPCFIVTPHVAAGTVDHHFYNTDSVLRTMEALLGLKPMCQYDAIAPVMNFIQPLASNDAPYTAILPSREIVTEVNDRTSYRAKDSQALDFSKEDQVPGPEMADILWGSIHNRPIDPRTR
jgi:YVTN family beta-propeller protein